MLNNILVRNVGWQTGYKTMPEEEAGRQAANRLPHLYGEF